MRRYLKWLLLPLVCAAVAPFTPAIDLALARAFFHEGAFFNNGVTRFLYDYGEWAGFVCGGIACALFLFSKKWRKPSLVLILTLIVGAGLIINFALKDHWGRPRPKQVMEFGGKHEFRPFFEPNFATTDPQKSFPSGHVAVGFYYLTLCILASRLRQRVLFWLGFALTLFWGGGLFFARIAQGGHFFSDALFSVLIMWEVALIIDWFVFEKMEQHWFT